MSTCWWGPRSAACAAPAATPQSGGEAPGQPVTDSGFVCPEPSPRLPVTSEELNLFVWTEYIPQDIVDCFELVYGIKVNQDYYSSTDEMYAKLSQGAQDDLGGLHGSRSVSQRRPGSMTAGVAAHHRFAVAVSSTSCMP